MPALEEILYKPIKVFFDHGFVKVVDYMGDDSAVVQGKGFLWRGTKRAYKIRALINYLMRHRHTTPFEMCDIKFH